MAYDTLFSTFTLGKKALRSRVVMAPMTRSRAIGNVPGPLVATYYAQRAEAGLIVTEGVSPSPNGLGYARIPGLFSAEQVEGWKAVTSAVHAAGGAIFAQLMHTGRASNAANLPPGARVVAPSAVRVEAEIWVDPDGPKPASEPAAMTDAEVEATIEEHVQAARNAVEAGLDGVEIHGANGYLVEQFLNTASNRRDDRWGGSIENRIRFAVEIARRTAAAIGGDRVGIRVSPYGAFNGMVADDATEDLFVALAEELSRIGVAYVHVVDHSSMGAPEVKPSIKQKLRQAFRGALVLSGGYDAARAEADLAEGRADLVAFGRPFLANPRLPTLLRAGKPLAAPDFATFYTPGEKGYTDYPVVG
jgi:N-ethylmaleimide reductase